MKHALTAPPAPFGSGSNYLSTKTRIETVIRTVHSERT
ncbi:hypothetical protein GMMP15_1900019 [Candidatus Magnetomoraceae bacterium gMMP-15]